MTSLLSDLLRALRRDRYSAHDKASEAGDTLVEVLISVVIISIAAAALLGTLTTSLAASGEHRSLSVDDNLLKSLAETAKHSIELDPASPQFAVCAGSYTVPFTLPSSDTGYSIAGYNGTNAVTITSNALPLSGSQYGIEYLNGTTFQPTSCNNTSPNNGAQLITLEVTAPNQITQFLSFIVRNPKYAP